MKKFKLLALVCIAMLCVTLCLSLSACDSKDAGITDDGLIWVKGEDGVHITGYFGITEDLVIPASIQNTPVVAIGNFTFQNNGMLKTITIPDSVTTIGDSAFSWCYNLTSIVIPDSVTTITDFAFYGCDNLKNVYYTGTAEKWAQISIGTNNSKITYATIHYNYVPEE